mgnify:CR=1 FL=1
MQNIEMEKRTLFVILLTLLTMFVEVAFGYISNSMALLADGWHMGTHVLAFSLTYFSFVIIRKMSNSDCFAFGTGKIGVLSGYTSSLFLGLTAFMLMFESVSRLFNPDKIAFDEAMVVVVIGLVVNLLCLKIMNNNHSFHSHHKHHDSENVNYKSAYLHILADVLTSVLAIVALVFGKFFNMMFLDALMGFVGGVIILKWACGLVKNSVGVLLDTQNDDLKNLIKAFKIINDNLFNSLSDKFSSTESSELLLTNLKDKFSLLNSKLTFERKTIKFLMLSSI